MFFKIMESKKGITLVEIMMVVIVLGILTAVGVPAFVTGYEIQARKDCRNQCIVIETLVKEAMTGMIDNGAAQYREKTVDGVVTDVICIDFSKVQDDHKATYEDDGIEDNSDDQYDGKPCFVLIEDQQIPGKIAFTMRDLRGYDESMANDDYADRCSEGYYLKKGKLKNVAFYKYLANQEIPVCPFSDADKGENYYYYIFEDGTVICSCPECHED